MGPGLRVYAVLMLSWLAVLVLLRDVEVLLHGRAGYSPLGRGLSGPSAAAEALLLRPRVLHALSRGGGRPRGGPALQAWWAPEVGGPNAARCTTDSKQTHKGGGRGKKKKLMLCPPRLLINTTQKIPASPAGPKTARRDFSRAGEAYRKIHVSSRIISLKYIVRGGRRLINNT